MPKQTQEGGPVDGWRDLGRVAAMSAPMHPILVHFTIALTAAALVFDAIWLLGGTAVGDVGWWLVLSAAIVTPLTVATGVVSRLRVPVEEGEARSFLRAHMALGPIFLGLLIAATVWRATLWETGLGPTVGYVVVLALVNAVMGLQGYLGGELVYRYGVEVEGTYRKLPGHAPDHDRPARPTESEEAA